MGSWVVVRLATTTRPARGCGGVEAQASAAGIRGRDNCGSNFFFGGKASCKTNVDALGSFAVRFGGTIDRALLFVKGGAAWAHETHTFDFFVGKNAQVSFEKKEWRWGAMLGAGVEFAFTNNISGKVEYNYNGLRQAVGPVRHLRVHSNPLRDESSPKHAPGQSRPELSLFRAGGDRQVLMTKY